MITRPLPPGIVGFTTALALASCIPAKGEAVPEVHPEIVSAWKLHGGNTLMVFRYDGIYYQIEDNATRPGFERGHYEWDHETGAFSVSPAVDTNGVTGLSHPGGATTLSVAGDTLTYTVAGSSPQVFSRVVNTSSAIVGSWFPTGERVSVTFLADGTYYVGQEMNDAPHGFDGMERGTYAWDPLTKVLTATAIIDTNGDTGLSSIPSGFTATVTGNRLVFDDDDASFQRINTSPRTLPDFAAFKSAVYWQSGGGGPVLMTPDPEEDDYPYYGGAEVEIPGASSPTLKIGSRPAVAMSPDDDDPTYFDIETGYSTLAALDAASGFPNNTDYEFRSGASAAVLRFPAGAALPAAPVVSTGDGSWENGVYQLPEPGILKWSDRAGYSAADDIGVLYVEDDQTGEDIVEDLVLQGDLSSYDFGGRLIPGRTYFVSLVHLKIQNTTTSGTGIFSGVTGIALTESITDFLIQAAPATAGSPVITEQPVSQGASPGDDVILTAGTMESPAAKFQWFKGASAIPGQTGVSLALFDLTEADYGTYTVKATANGITVESAPAVIRTPAEAAYAAYVDGFDLDLETDGAPGADHDRDGVANLLEYLLGGNPIIPNPGILPALSSTPSGNGRTLTFTYDRKITVEGIQQIVEHSSTLTPPWTAATHGESGVTIAAAPVPGNAGLERVTVTIPVTGGKRFARLRATW